MHALCTAAALKVLHFLSAGRDTTETQHLPNVLDALPSLQELVSGAHCIPAL